VNTSSLWRFAPLLALTPVVLMHCGGSDNSDINGDERLRDAGSGGALGDASDVRGVDGSFPPGCPILQPLPGRACPASMLMCTYGDNICACSTNVPWMCFDTNDGGRSPDSGGRDGAGGSGGTSVDAGGGTDGARPDGGRADVGSNLDGSVDAGRDAGRGGGGAAGAAGRGGTGGTGGRGGGGTGGTGGGGGRGGRGGTTRDGGSDVRDAATDGGEDTGGGGGDTDGAVDSGGPDGGSVEDGATTDDAGDDGG
jgi:hypothetical protein